MRYVKQDGIKDCGVACLYNIIRYHKGNVSMNKIRKLTNTNENGTSIYNIVETAKKLGLDSKAYNCELNDLSNIDFPVIAYMRINNFYHYVIIKDIDIDKITIFDPIRGNISYLIDNFLNEFQNIIITFKKTNNIVNEQNDFINYLKELVLNDKKFLIVLLSLYLITSILDLLFQISFKNIFNLNKSRIIFMIILILLKIIFTYIKNIFSLKYNNKIDLKLSSKVYDKLFNLPYMFYHDRPVGDITSKINDLYYVKDFINHVTTTSIIDILLIIFILIYLLFTSFKFFILLSLFIIIFITFNYYTNKEENKRLDSLKNSNSFNSSCLIDNILGIDTIKNLNIENKVIEKQKVVFKNYISSFYKYHVFVNFESSVINFFSYYPIIILLLNHNSYLNGEIIVLYNLIITFFISVNNLYILYKKFIDSSMSFTRLNTFLNQETTTSNEKIIKAITEINFKNVDYKIGNRKLINKFNLTINKGDNIFISGDSGVGKSTLFKLLNKDLIVNDNSIFINNIDINILKESSIKKNICYVSQNEYIFNDTIKNNILLYSNINNKELNKILKITMVDKILKDRNIDLNFILEENGHNLSGGERQKILLARTLARNIDYLILDETTSEIDIKSERKILERMITEYKKTLILISHRKSNIDLFSKKVFM